MLNSKFCGILIYELINKNMKLKAVIEIPKGNDRRWHLHYDKTTIIDCGSIIERIPVNGGIMPVAYGYLEGTENKEENSEEIENIDVLVFSKRNFIVGEKVDVEIFGCIKRADGDHKILASDESVLIEKWTDVSDEERELVLKFFGYNHPIILVEGKTEAEEYVKKSFV